MKSGRSSVYAATENRSVVIARGKNGRKSTPSRGKNENANGCSEKIEEVREDLLEPLGNIRKMRENPSLAPLQPTPAMVQETSERFSRWFSSDHVVLGVCAVCNQHKPRVELTKQVLQHMDTAYSKSCKSSWHLGQTRQIVNVASTIAPKYHPSWQECCYLRKAVRIWKEEQCKFPCANSARIR